MRAARTALRFAPVGLVAVLCLCIWGCDVPKPVVNVLQKAYIVSAGAVQVCDEILASPSLDPKLKDAVMTIRDAATSLKGAVEVACKILDIPLPPTITRGSPKVDLKAAISDLDGATWEAKKELENK